MSTERKPAPRKPQPKRPAEPPQEADELGSFLSGLGDEDSVSSRSSGRAPAGDTSESSGTSQPARKQQQQWLIPMLCGSGFTVVALILLLIANSGGSAPEAAPKKQYKPNWSKHKLDKLPSFKNVQQAALPPPPAPGQMPAGGLDLMRLIDPIRDGVSGTWRKMPSSQANIEFLMSGNKVERLRIPYRPPEQYSLELKVIREFGEGPLNLILVGFGSQFAAILDARGGKCSGLHLVDGQTLLGNPTTNDTTVFTNKKAHQVKVDVTRSGVKVTVDDRTIVDFQGEFSRLSMDNSWEGADSSALYLGTTDSVYLIETLRLTAIQDDAAASAPAASADAPESAPAEGSPAESADPAAPASE